MSILISFLYLLLYIAIVIFIAWAIHWVITGFMGWQMPPKLFQWGQIIVGLICLIAIAVWLGGVLGMGSGLPRFNFR